MHPDLNGICRVLTLIRMVSTVQGDTVAPRPTPGGPGLAMSGSFQKSVALDNDPKEEDPTCKDPKRDAHVYP